MAELERAIKGLECCLVGPLCSQCPYENDCDSLEKIMTEALELLKEREPVLVSQYWDDAYGDYVNACECGNHWISIDGSLVNYCPSCGKAVKWDDELPKEGE